MIANLGSARDFWGIRKFLASKQMQMKHVHDLVNAEPDGNKPLGYQNVWATIRGFKNNRRVLRQLVKIGVPPELLDLPEDLQAEAAERNREVV